MTKKRTRKLSEAEQAIKMLKERGFTPITEEDKKKFWYKQHVEQLEHWRREELGKPFTVKEREALYSTAKSKSKKVKVKS